MSLHVDKKEAKGAEATLLLPPKPHVSLLQQAAQKANAIIAKLEKGFDQIGQSMEKRATTIATKRGYDNY